MESARDLPRPRSRTSEPRPRGRALSASTTPVIASLADVYCYQTNDHDLATVTSSGDLQPPTTHRRSFPKALKRLRDRLRILEERLTLDTNGLRQEVLNLELAKSLLEKKLHDRDTRQRAHAVAVVTEYFAVFQHGWLRSSADGVDRQVGHIHADRHQNLVVRQQQFLATAVDPVILDQLVAHWEQWSGLYAETQLELEHIECVGDADEAIVVARGVFAALPQDYSRVVLDDERAAERLRTVRTAYPCRVVCCFTPSGLIIRHDMELDHVAALQSTLGTLAYVHHVVTRRASSPSGGRA